MPRLIRFVALSAAGALTLAGAATGLVAVGRGLVRHAATAEAIPLPPLQAESPLGGSTVYASDGHTVLAVLHASESRKPVPLSHVAKVLITAVLDTEDHRFYVHGGFDLPSALRALAADSSGAGIQGGSTIAQQLVKQTYLTSVQKISRKIKEAVLAVRLERKYTKNEILQAYLNSIYLGNGAYGVEAAANAYFGEHASGVDLPQAALLAGLIQNPSGYDPILNPEGARRRRAEVLGRMVHYGDITPAQAAAANATPLPTRRLEPHVQSDQISDYYVLEVRDELLGPNSPLGGTYDQRYQALFEGGLKIYTNLDPALQKAAERAVAADSPPNKRGFEEGLVAIDPATGAVRAMVGGLGVKQSAYDVVTQGLRQPGSGFKVFTLLAALQKGYSIYDTVDSQSPCAINFPTDHALVSHPINNDTGNGGGIVTVLNATALSINCAYIRLAHEVGLYNVIDMAHRLGISEKLPPYPSMVIGSIAVHPIEMAAAYATLADDGVYHTPTFIRKVLDRSGATIFSASRRGHRVISSQLAREANVAFQAVVQYGTGTSAQLPGRQVAGKTGTTNSYVDAWFNGYTPQLEATVWMGDLHAEVPMVNVDGVAAVYGATFPAQTWNDFMAQALANAPLAAFLPPDPSQLPAPRYITSPALVRDDVLDHNYAPPPTTVPPSTTSPPTTASPTTTSPPSTTAPPKRGHHG